VQLTPESVTAGCSLHQTSVENLKLEVSDPAICGGDPSCTLGAGKFGEGYVHSGSNSCTTRIIGGRMYSWGSPCPE
jgi:hypothetical protein